MTGLAGGGALVGAAVKAGPGRPMLVILASAVTLPFVAFTWWAIVTPILTVVALVIGLAATGVVRRSKDDAKTALSTNAQVP